MGGSIYRGWRVVRNKASHWSISAYRLVYFSFVSWSLLVRPMKSGRNKKWVICQRTYLLFFLNLWEALNQWSTNEIPCLFQLVDPCTVREELNSDQSVVGWYFSLIFVVVVDSPKIICSTVDRLVRIQLFSHCIRPILTEPFFLHYDIFIITFT